jgi:hypothetical protein
MPFFVEKPADEQGNRRNSPAVIEAEIGYEKSLGMVLKVKAPTDFKWPEIVYYPEEWIECEGPARHLRDWKECDEVIAKAEQAQKFKKFYVGQSVSLRSGGSGPWGGGSLNPTFLLQEGWKGDPVVVVEADGDTAAIVMLPSGYRLRVEPKDMGLS